MNIQSFGFTGAKWIPLFFIQYMSAHSDASTFTQPQKEEPLPTNKVGGAGG